METTLLEAAAEFAEGYALLKERDIPGALSSFQNAERLGYSWTECAAARWKCWMLLGNFERAWAESDAIAASGQADVHRLWYGGSWRDQRVMVRGLHGLGDTIQFVRYAPMLAETARAVYLQVHPQLVTLIEGVKGVDAVFTWDGRIDGRESEWDVQMEITELPRIFRTNVHSVPASVPYIDIPAERHEWASRVVGQGTGRKVGLAWDAGEWDTSRRIPLQLFEPILEAKGYRFFSLQKDSELGKLSRGRMLDIEAYSRDVRDTAALTCEMDLVISTDTVTAHLAGALGKTVWILLPHEADWRWMLDRDDSPWYPTARLFRQARAGEWSDVISRIQQELKKASI